MQRLDRYAYMDYALFTDGLFVPCRGTRRTSFRAESHPNTKNPNQKWYFEGPTQLSAFDQSVFLSLMCNFYEKVEIYENVNGLDTKRIYVYEAYKEYQASEIAILQISRRCILKDIGYLDIDSGSAMQDLANSINRIRKTNLIQQYQDSTESIYPMISVSNGCSSDALLISIHPRFVSAALKESQYAKIPIFERNLLMNDEVAKLIYTYLCAYTRPGQIFGNPVSGTDITKLALHVWGSDKQLTIRHLRRLVQALDHIRDVTSQLDDDLRWKIMYPNPYFFSSKVRIRRPTYKIPDVA